jgi:hypothetical protein
MEHLVRVRNESDRQLLSWLRERVGEEALAKAVSYFAGPEKPCLSQLCRQLGVRTPWGRLRIRKKSYASSCRRGWSFVRSMLSRHRSSAR